MPLHSVFYGLKIEEQISLTARKALFPLLVVCLLEIKYWLHTPKFAISTKFFLHVALQPLFSFELLGFSPSEKQKVLHIKFAESLFKTVPGSAIY